MSQCSFPLSRGILYLRSDSNRQRLPLGYQILSLARFNQISPLRHFIELLTGNDPIYLVHKTSASPLMLKKRIETPDGFEPTYHSFADWDLSHSDTVSFLLLSVRVTIPPPLVYQTSALPNELTDNFCSPGRLRSDSLHYVTVATELTRNL